MDTQHLLVADPAGSIELVPLPHPPQDVTSFAELVAVLGPEREVTPAGPPLRGPGQVVHRVRGKVTTPSSSISDELRPLVSTALDEERGGPVPLERAAWCRAGWAEQTAAWVDEVLAQRGEHRTGRSTVLKSWGLSQVERIPTSNGIRYLKACSPLFAHEPVTTAWLADAAPAVVPGVLAIDEARACLLMHALPPAMTAMTVEQERLATCTAMAQMQEAVAGRMNELRASGAPDRGLSSTSRELVSMLQNGLTAGHLDGRRHRELETGVQRALVLLDELADCGLPDDALVHGDLYPANVVVASSGAVIFDWSDACLGHPVLDLAHLCADRPRTARPELDWNAPWVQAYLEPWRAGCAESKLKRALELADVADLAFQAVTYERIQASMEPDERQDPDGGATARALGALVDNLPAR
ncbi:aminoglycoside phosphotransferase family protein [Allobranchiibius sp. GilTou73]|uniref:aminoglycoside phosphotransferase family protein n=1 Tax=Allobranchiibius sp. GilTou73 TaxID=2904523 RepID=UPI001F1DDBD0|nr:aminoglycoside phosphotransferase family protein [Allobranchiibius sp. GilTou73]UIJ33953.1 aminoglycoside phosphotransferase family protein [Allobranchiibius sp. GilTou73]